MACLLKYVDKPPLLIRAGSLPLDLEGGPGFGQVELVQGSLHESVVVPFEDVVDSLVQGFLLELLQETCSAHNGTECGIAQQVVVDTVAPALLRLARVVLLWVQQIDIVSTVEIGDW